MGFDFTIAVTPSVSSINQELNYIKSALLYADRITLISPLVYMYTQLSTKGLTVDERTIMRLLNFILPLCEKSNPQIVMQVRKPLNEFKEVVYSKKYKGLSYLQKMNIRQQLSEIASVIDNELCKLIGQEQSSELDVLLKSKKLHLQTFEHNLADIGGCTIEFFRKLQKAVKDSYPLFDETSNSLMVAAMQSHIVQFTETERRKITHAGLSDNLIQRLPSFESATVKEILDIREELEAPLIRYRSKILAYSDSIQALPWDDSFENECSELYYKEVSPAVEEIVELTSENGFLKNLGYAALSNGDFLKSTGGLACSIAAGGVIGAYNNAIATDNAVLITGSAWAVSKIAQSYHEYKKKQKEIQRKDMYFYYQAGKKLQKLKG